MLQPGKTMVNVLCVASEWNSIDGDPVGILKRPPFGGLVEKLSTMRIDKQLPLIHLQFYLKDAGLTKETTYNAFVTQSVSARSRLEARKTNQVKRNN